MSSPDVEPRPSATVVLLRDAGAGAEVLLVRRSRALDFHGGAWVFPGGRIEPTDAGETGDWLSAARRAAVRETQEEVGLEPELDGLVWLSRWTTPRGRPKRFVTWFFAGRAPAAEPRVDGREISAHVWLTPDEALERQRKGSLELPPPTFVTLHGLVGAPNTLALLDRYARQRPEDVLPHPQRLEDGFCSLYPGDAGYESGDLRCPGPRNRLWMQQSGWRYERSGQ